MQCAAGKVSQMPCPTHPHIQSPPCMCVSHTHTHTHTHTEDPPTEDQPIPCTAATTKPTKAGSSDFFCQVDTSHGSAVSMNTASCMNSRATFRKLYILACCHATNLVHRNMCDQLLFNFLSDINHFECNELLKKGPSVSKKRPSTGKKSGEVKAQGALAATRTDTKPYATKMAQASHTPRKFRSRLESDVSHTRSTDVVHHFGRKERDTVPGGLCDGTGSAHHSEDESKRSQSRAKQLATLVQMLKKDPVLRERIIEATGTILGAKSRSRRRNREHLRRPSSDALCSSCEDIELTTRAGSSATNRVRNLETHRCGSRGNAPSPEAMKEILVRADK